MHEIICPHCGKAFKIDEGGYANILKQVRDGEFGKQLHERLELAEQDKRNAVELAQTKSASEFQKAAAAKDTEIQNLQAKVDASEVARRLAVAGQRVREIGQHGRRRGQFRQKVGRWLTFRSMDKPTRFVSDSVTLLVTSGESLESLTYNGLRVVSPHHHVTGRPTYAIWKPRCSSTAKAWACVKFGAKTYPKGSSPWCSWQRTIARRPRSS